MMNEQAVNKVRQDADKVKKDFSAMLEDSISQLSEEFDKLTGEAKETVVGVTATMKKEVGNGLSQYNAKAQEVANKVPGGLGEKAVRYPWVALSVAVVVGFLLGSLLKPVGHIYR
jgi:ElaB/YqjD/DUF883 family membrane-anchored ribosome-binding protein